MSYHDDYTPGFLIIGGILAGMLILFTFFILWIFHANDHDVKIAHDHDQAIVACVTAGRAAGDCRLAIIGTNR